MRKNRYFIIVIYLISFISLLFYPYKLNLFLDRFISCIASYRFRILTKTRGNIFIRQPFTVKGHRYIKVGENFIADAGLRVECWDNYKGQKFSPTIHIGDNVSFNFRCHLGAINNITIGNNVLVGSQVLITDHSHGSWEDSKEMPVDRKLYSKGKILIEDNVWIGEGACILPNVTIGRNSIIGANAVVVEDIPSYSLAVGNPAKVVKKLK